MSESTADPVEALLNDVIELPDAEQTAALGALCAEHPRLAGELRSRFATYRRLQHITPSDASPIRGRRFGEFELERELGRGGMGIVYLARQRRAGGERRVALKIIRDRSLLSERAHERFRREAAASFRLDDPGLCPVFDAGEVDGTPWLAMRYVVGRTLAEHIGGARQTGTLALPATATAGDGSESGSSATSSAPTQSDRFGPVLALGESIARSLHVAHEAGFVHRDVKPSNVMVTPDGQPVLLDFGLVHDAGAASSLTMTGETIGTPAYMAPEQINGDGPIDRTTDVYSLAATLFEAIALEPPFGGRTRDELFANILQQPPADLRRLVPNVPRDLHTVLGTALSRDPALRYATALEFALDLGRVRQNKPILARPPGVLRRVRMWAARNRVAAALMTALLVALIAVVLVAVDAREQRNRAAAALQSARLAVAEMIRVQEEDLADVPWLEPQRRELQQRALAFLRAFRSDNANTPELALDQAEATILAARLELTLGNAEAGTRLRDEAQATLAAVPPAAPGRNRILGALASLSGTLATRIGDNPEATRQFRKAADQYLRVDPNDDDILAATAALQRGARAHELCNDRDQAFAALDEAAELVERAAPATHEITLARAMTLAQRARLRLEASDLDAADADCVAATTLLRQVLEQHPYDRRAVTELARIRGSHAAVLRRQGRGDELRAALTEAGELWQQLAASFPSTLSYRRSVAENALTRAPILFVDGEAQAAREQLERARRQLGELIEEAPDAIVHRRLLVMACLRLGQYHVDQPEVAGRHYTEAVEHARQLVDQHPDDAEGHFLMAQAATNLGTTLTTREDPAALAALTLGRRHAAIMRQMRPDDHRPHALYASSAFGEASEHAELSNDDEATRLFDEALDAGLHVVRQAPRDLRRLSSLLTYGVFRAKHREAVAPQSASASWDGFVAIWAATDADARARLLRFGVNEPEFCMLLRGRHTAAARAGDPPARAAMREAIDRLYRCNEGVAVRGATIQLEILHGLAALLAGDHADATDRERLRDEFERAVADWPRADRLRRIDRRRLACLSTEARAFGLPADVLTLLDALAAR